MEVFVDEEKIADVIHATRKMRMCAVNNIEDPSTIEGVFSDARTLTTDLSNAILTGKGAQLEDHLADNQRRYGLYRPLSYGTPWGVKHAAQRIGRWVTGANREPTDKTVEKLLLLGAPRDHDISEAFQSEDTLVFSPMASGFLLWSVVAAVLRGKGKGVPQVEPAIVDKSHCIAVLPDDQGINQREKYICMDDTPPNIRFDFKETTYGLTIHEMRRRFGEKAIG